MKPVSFFAAIALSLLISSCSKDTIVNVGDGKLSLQFDAKIGSADFSLNSAHTIGSRTYEFSHFRYWVSNLVLVKSDGSEYAVPDAYYLLEETNPVPVQDGSYTYPARKRETVSLSAVPMAEYKAIRFHIGVDATHNDNLSIQGGELSQLNGMTNVSWMWHTSYIFTSLQGKVTEGATSKSFVAETGLNENYKEVSIELSEPVKVSSSKDWTIQLNVDVAKLIDGIDLIANPTIGASQASLMSQMATNFASNCVSLNITK